MTYSKLIRLAHTGRHPPATLVLIPGGPGLSSATIRDLDILQRSFDLIYVETPGSFGSPLSSPISYEAFVDDVERALKEVEGSILLGGHSFGGLVAAELATRKNLEIRGLLMISAPIRTVTLDRMNEIFGQNQTAELKATGKQWSATKSDQSFREWIGACAPLYFTGKNVASGKSLLLKGQVSANLFIGARSAASGRDWVLEKCRELTIPKLFIAGEEDVMLPPSMLALDASTGGFEFKVIKNASHFVMVDQPNEVANIVENKFNKGEEK